jgi:hypothetical protein
MRFPFSLEFCVGTAIGFLLASLMLNASYGWSAGIYFVPVVVFALLGLIVGFIRKKMGKKTILSGHQWIWCKMACVLAVWIICALGPYLFMKGFYFISAVDMPVPTGWKRVSIQTTVLGMDNGAGYHITLEGEGDIKEALQFYCQFLESEGWFDCTQDYNDYVSNAPGYIFTYKKERDIITLVNHHKYPLPTSAPIHLHYSDN